MGNRLTLEVKLYLSVDNIESSLPRSVSPPKDGDSRLTAMQGARGALMRLLVARRDGVEADPGFAAGDAKSELD